MRVIDITGRRFGKLVVTDSLYRYRKHNSTVLVDCDCGRRGVEKFKQHILKGMLRHCGCETGWWKRKHGHSKSRLYKAWQSAKYRNRVCGKWRRFEAMAGFFNWETDLRVVPRDYSRPLGPSNYLIVDGLHRASRRMVIINGKPLTLTQCAAALGVSRERARQLHNRGFLEDRMYGGKPRIRGKNRKSMKAAS